MELAFEKYGITRRLSSSGGRTRVYFLVEIENEPSKILKSRHEVVLFLAKHPEIDLQPQQFSFKLETEDTEQSSSFGPEVDKEGNKGQRYQIESEAAQGNDERENNIVPSVRRESETVITDRTEHETIKSS